MIIEYAFQANSCGMCSQRVEIASAWNDGMGQDALHCPESHSGSSTESPAVRGQTRVAPNAEALRWRLRGLVRRDLLTGQFSHHT
jgi:hypothetical protein